MSNSNADKLMLVLSLLFGLFGMNGAKLYAEGTIPASKVVIVYGPSRQSQLVVNNPSFDEPDVPDGTTQTVTSTGWSYEFSVEPVALTADRNEKRKKK